MAAAAARKYGRTAGGENVWPFALGLQSAGSRLAAPMSCVEVALRNDGVQNESIAGLEGNNFALTISTDGQK